MDLEESDVGSGDAVNGLDAFLVSAGVAVLAVIPTYFLTIFKPTRFGAKLDPRDRQGTDLAFLGPGIFFVVSLLFVIITTTFVLVNIGQPSDSTIEMARDQNGGAYQFGTALGQLMNAMEDRVTSGDFWSAVATGLPVFAFAIALALPFRLVSFAVSGWTMRHAMGAALYVTGGLLVGTGLVVLLASAFGWLAGTMTASLTAFFGMLVVFMIPALQTWGFGSAFKEIKDARLGLLSALMPFIILAIIFAFAFLVVGAMEPISDAAPE